MTWHEVTFEEFLSRVAASGRPGQFRQCCNLPGVQNDGDIDVATLPDGTGVAASSFSSFGGSDVTPPDPPQMRYWIGTSK